MDEPYRIRPGSAADAGAIARAEAACFSDPWSERGIRELFEIETVLSLVAETDRPDLRLAGYLFARVIAGEAEILSVAVLPAARRRGIGARLLEDTLADLEARGVGAVFLEVRESNEAARRLYEDFGFRAVGIRADYYQKPREHAVVLRRDLGSGLN